MKVYCKSAIDELIYRDNLKHDGIEIQLLDDFKSNYKGSKCYLEEMKDYLNDIETVHSPLYRNEMGTIDAINLQELLEKDVRHCFFQTCELAEEISKVTNKNITVIIHTGIDYSDVYFNKAYFNDIVELLKCTLNNYPHIKIAIENVLPIYSFSWFRLLNGGLPSYGYLILKIREKLKTDRIGAVLDTCHALSACEFANNLFQHETADNIEKAKLTLANFFETVKDFLFVIHLADGKDMGLNPQTHGLPFTQNEESVNLLDEIMSQYANHSISCPITIEVKEDDYSNCINYTETREQLNRYI